MSTPCSSQHNNSLDIAVLYAYAGRPPNAMFSTLRFKNVQHIFCWKEFYKDQVWFLVTFLETVIFNLCWIFASYIRVEELAFCGHSYIIVVVVVVVVCVCVCVWERERGGGGGGGERGAIDVCEQNKEVKYGRPHWMNFPTDCSRKTKHYPVSTNYHRISATEPISMITVAFLSKEYVFTSIKTWIAKYWSAFWDTLYNGNRLKSIFGLVGCEWVPFCKKQMILNDAFPHYYLVFTFS